MDVAKIVPMAKVMIKHDVWMSENALKQAKYSPNDRTKK
jgi:hypothetical protein